MIHLAAVRKKEDPILKTQTDPIAYKEKMEEIKDGEKGAPSPSMERYPESEFLAEPPVEDGAKTPAKNETEDEAIPDLGGTIPEDTGLGGEELEWEEWADDEEGQNEGIFEGEGEFKEEDEMDVKAT